MKAIDLSSQGNPSGMPRGSDGFFSDLVDVERLSFPGNPNFSLPAVSANGHSFGMVEFLLALPSFDLGFPHL
ncbi:MAG: hypothetical protein IPL83_03910 [Bdellovibrionales bacterium]|nr:hypothetical protein [Bdellovibrionales bacterium]